MRFKDRIPFASGDSSSLFDDHLKRVARSRKPASAIKANALAMVTLRKVNAAAREPVVR
jgi:hypothetical protein